MSPRAATVPKLVPLAELLAATRAEHAGRVALVDRDRSLTYAELGERSSRLAAALHDLGARPGDRVILAASNRCEWVETEHALAGSGLVRVALVPRLHPRELAHIASDCDPFAVIAEAELLASTGLDWIPEGTRQVIVIGSAAGLNEGVIEFEQLIDSVQSRQLPAPDAEDLAALWYTSGSTGLPKGVLCSHRTFGASTRNILSVMPLLSTDVAMHTAPISHWSGAIGLALSAVGGCNRLRPGFDVGEIADQVAANDVTVLPLVPTQISMLIDRVEPAEARARMDSIRLIPYAGSAIPPDRLDRAVESFPDALAQFYGSAEVPAPITYLSPEDHKLGETKRLRSAGRTHPLTEVRISDPAGELGIGEIACRGRQVTSGYWRQPESTAEVRDEAGWFRTGDVGYLDDEDFLFIVDRKKEMIISGGFNVYPREVENAISSLPGVAEVAVIGSPDEKWGEAVTAVVVVAEGAALEEGDVISRCRDSIAGYKVPKRVEFVDSLPKSSTGKVRKRELRAARWAGRERRI
ncbi:MAG: AMP-binding protein [Thermoleophilia bacterium]|nr:AMP-binding protein [Thermoleophilia bacterium]